MAPRHHSASHGQSTIVTIALFVPLAIALVLLALTLSNESARRDTQTRVLHDYATIAAHEIARALDSVLHADVTASLYPAANNGAPPPSDTGSGLRRRTQLRTTTDPQVLLDVRGEDSQAIRELARTAFRFDAATKELIVRGEPYDAVTAAALVAMLDDAVAMRSTEPHRFVVEAIAGKQRAFALHVIEPPNDAGRTVYGLETTPAALGTAVAQILRTHDVLPSAVVRAPYAWDVLQVGVATKRGVPVWTNGDIHDGARSATDTTNAANGSIRLMVSAGPGLVTALRIGRPSPLYVPALIAVLLLSLVLPGLALQQLRRRADVEKLRDKFVANVSHELRTPLTHISMFAEMLALGRDRSDKERARYADTIHREAKRLTALTGSVLRFSRGDSEATLTIEPRDISEEVREAVEFFTPLAAAADAHISLDAAPQLRASVDAGALRQILLNVLDNAAKFGPRDQTITVVVRGAHDAVSIDVSDEGPGVDAKDRTRVFEPYVRVERDDAPKVAGTGIGLSVVKDLVAKQSGSVAFVNRARGATVRITFPRIA